MLKIFISWYFIEKPKNLLKIGKNFFLFSLKYFSIILLLKTLFSYWRSYKWSYGKGFDIKRYIEVFLSNLISRTIGAIIRFLLIFVGLIIQVLIVLITIIVIVLWFSLPILIPIFFLKGIRGFII